MLGAHIAVIGVSAACTLVNMHLCPARAIDKAGTHVMPTDDFVGTHQEPRMIQNDRLKELITIFYVHSKILPSDDMRKHYKNDLLSFVNRMNRHLADYYSNNEYITNAFQIIKKLVSDWY